MVAGLEDIGVAVAVADVVIGDVVADADELELVVFWVEAEDEEIIAEVDDVLTIHWLFWQL